MAREIGPDVVGSAIRRFLEQHSDELRVRDIEHASFLLYRGISAILHHSLEERPGLIGEASFRAELIDLFHCYLTGADAI